MTTEASTPAPSPFLLFGTSADDDQDIVAARIPGTEAWNILHPVRPSFLRDPCCLPILLDALAFYNPSLPRECRNNLVISYLRLRLQELAKPLDGNQQELKIFTSYIPFYDQIYRDALVHRAYREPLHDFILSRTSQLPSGSKPIVPICPPPTVTTCSFCGQPLPFQLEEVRSGRNAGPVVYTAHHGLFQGVMFRRVCLDCGGIHLPVYARHTTRKEARVCVPRGFLGPDVYGVL